MAIDPVCGMTVDEKTEKEKFTYKGTTYYFCGRGCRLEFQDDPEKHLSPAWKPGGMEAAGGGGHHQ